MRRDVLSLPALISFHILHFALKSKIKKKRYINKSRTENKYFLHHLSSVEFHSRYVLYRSRVSSAFLQNRKDSPGPISLVASVEDLNSCVRHRARRAARLRAARPGV